jgi:hypothetical protein
MRTLISLIPSSVSGAASRLPLIFAAAGLLAGLTPVRPARAAGEATVNACGCGTDVTGSCFCQKVARCGCPGECEPKGCEEKRTKKLEKEIEVEMKRAADEDRKRNAPPPVSRVERSDEEDDADEPPLKTKSSGRTEVASFTPRQPKVATVKKMSASQKRELSHLLDAYLTENPDRRNQSVDQVRGDLD